MQLYSKISDNNHRPHKDKDLTFLANFYEADKGDADPLSLSWGGQYPNHSTMGYTKTYEKYMFPKKYEQISLIEVGIADPRFRFASTKMWTQYFDHINLYSIDNFWNRSPKNEDLELIRNIGCNFIYADQGSEQDWLEIKNIIPNNSIDFFIEDGSHQPHHMYFTLFHSCDLMKSGGYYFMEDIQSLRLPKFIFDAYDHEILTKEMIDSFTKNSFYTSYLTDEQNDKINKCYQLIDLVLDDRDTNHLGIFRKR